MINTQLSDCAPHILMDTLCISPKTVVEMNNKKAVNETKYSIKRERTGIWKVANKHYSSFC